MKKILIFALSLSLLAACGVKPKDIEPPEGANEGDFPRVYPDPGLDSSPASEAAKIGR